MRIRTQLFLGTAALVAALVGVQWWLQSRQLEAVERELVRVAAQVGQNVMFRQTIPLPAEGRRLVMQRVTADKASAPGKDALRTTVAGPEPMTVKVTREAELHLAGDGDKPRPAGGEVVEEKHTVLIRSSPGAPGSPARNESKVVWVTQSKNGIVTRFEGDKYTVVRVDTVQEKQDRFLVIEGMPGAAEKIRIPITQTAQAVRKTQREGLLAGGVLLGLGLLAAGAFTFRVTQPIRQLKAGAEALGEGAFGVQVPVKRRGELGELQSPFNRVSARLAALEQEKEAWQAREHLAQLGGLAKGLAHTLRNPLHTLGLVVEELARRGNGEAQELVGTARGQIRRVDRWLKSFLAIDAEGVAAPEAFSVGPLLQDLALEAIQSGGAVELSLPPAPVYCLAVAPALRAALANLIENAVQASPAGTAVAVSLATTDGGVVIRIRDRGAGLPAEVRERLFAPHVTTKPGGAGMGLFLARQLIEGIQGGRLALADAVDGGTEARVELVPAAAPAPGEGDADGGAS